MAKVKNKTAKSKTAPAAKPAKAAAKPAKAAAKPAKALAPKAATTKPAPKVSSKVAANAQSKAGPKTGSKAVTKKLPSSKQVASKHPAPSKPAATKATGPAKQPVSAKPATAAKQSAPAKPLPATPIPAKPVPAKPPTKLLALTIGIASRPHIGPMKIVNAELPPVPSAIPPATVLPGDAPRSKMGSGLGNRPMKRPKLKKIYVMPALGEPLIRPGAKRPVPLIASGPKAPIIVAKAPPALNGHGKKTLLPKKELDRYRDILIHKRAELAGDVSNMEGEALQNSSGSLSHTPQHMADQGSDSYDQSISLDIAQVDRNLIREIDDALARIVKQTFGLCEVTGKPINKERLDELPWTRFSIEAARANERRANLP